MQVILFARLKPAHTIIRNGSGGRVNRTPVRLRHLKVCHAVMPTGCISGGVSGSVSGALIDGTSPSSTVSCGMQTRR